MGIIIQDKVESNTPASWHDAAAAAAADDDDDDDGACILYVLIVLFKNKSA